jgi:diphthine synthase
MLYLVGIGLSKSDLPAGALDIFAKCKIYVDRYTTYVTQDRIDQIEELTGKEVTSLDRSAMEENLSKLIEEAREKNVAVLIGGDPLVATTHKIIFTAAKRANVPVRVNHAVSVLTVLMGESGLDFYRFGQVCTISKWVDHYKPVSFYETIQRNLSNNLHSIVLLDFDQVSNSSLSLKEAIRILKAAEANYKGGIAIDDKEVMIMHKVTLSSERKILTKLKDADKIVLEEGPTSIIIPAKLSDIEREIIGSIY